MAKTEMKRKSTKEIIEQGIREGWIRPAEGRGPIFQDPPIDSDSEGMNALECLYDDRDREDEKFNAYVR